MNDEELFDLVATIWVRYGGDVTGFMYSQSKIIDAIDKKIKEM